MVSQAALWQVMRIKNALKRLLSVNFDSINPLVLSPSFLLDEVHISHVNADATSLPASTLSWF